MPDRHNTELRASVCASVALSTTAAGDDASDTTQATTGALRASDAVGGLRHAI